MSESNTVIKTAIEKPETGELHPGDFFTFFKDIHSYEPFPWQTRLTKQVLENCAWPKVIDLPTGTGKTAVLDTAVFAMAAQPAISPRRVVFVIDRRIVVDQVYERARRIRKRIEEADTPVLERVRSRLQELSDGRPLGVAALRGGIPLDRGWTRRPDQPWVVVSTVDQFGSRLLFRGYGVTPGMRPIHAGLAGNDCLVILDEVHLSVPFAETLAQVSVMHSGPLPRRFATVEMSATPGNEQAQRFTLDVMTDLDGCEELERRVKACKHAELVTVQSQEAISAAVLKIVKSIDKSIRKNESLIRSIGVVVNLVRTAREAHGALAAAGYTTHLITGRMRPLDRIGALEKIDPIVDPDGNERGDRLSVVVATQAIEVGADFSFDALITECAAVDSLRQRFGRLDRRGTYHENTGFPAKAWIIGPKSVVGSKRPDPIYGVSTRVTWEELKRRDYEGPLDVGPMSLGGFPDNAVAPRANAPLVLRTHMNAWVQTRPEPIVQPSVDWFLHGMDQNVQADVSILWRWDPSAEALQLVPPRQAEFLQIPIGAAKSWLANRPEVDIADAGHTRESGNISTPEGQAEDWVRWAGVRKGIERIGIRDIRPGDILVVEPTRGGLNGGTWDPSSEEEVLDLGDEAQIAYGRKATLRLDPRLIASLAPPTPIDENNADSPTQDRIANWLEDQQNASTCALKQEAVTRLRGNFEVTAVGINGENHEKGYYILTERDDITGKPLVEAETMDGSDETGSFTATGVSLDQHLSGVGERAGQIAERLGLPHGMVADLCLAGRLHDLGKVDPRFQLELAGGDPVELETRHKEPLAKSLPGARRVREYPKGMRHELASVAMIESDREVLSSSHDKDLVLHLVGTHHGWGRPLPPIIEDPEPQALTYTLDGHQLEANSDLAGTSLALDMTDRFWRLVERYGYHGLAWLEAILRLADQQQSAEEARQS